jgi:hypothetical protein
MCLCYVLLHLYVHCIWFEMNILFELYIVRGKNFSLHTQLLPYLLLLRGFCCKYFCMVFVVLNAIFVLVLLNRFRIYLVSCPKYVNVINLFCSWVFVLGRCWLVVFLFLLLLLGLSFTDSVIWY